MNITDFIFHIDWQFLSPLLLMLPVVGYAEIHYRFPFLPSRLFKKEPEILFDLPLRAAPDKAVPLFLFLKDAHRFPVTLQNAAIAIQAPEGRIHRYSVPLNEKVAAGFCSRTLPLPETYFRESGDYRITAELTFLSPRGKKKKIVRDNYRGLSPAPFRLTVSGDKLPAAENWYWGDLHVHSSYTADQVEFGAPPAATVEAAKCSGLDFVAVTDHSYDLDDLPDNFLRNDPELGKWTRFRREAAELQKESGDFVIIPGEEVSVGNRLEKNVHCLILNDPQFHPGDGDSAERLRRNRPTLSLPELLREKSEAALAIAAHPLETPPLSQQIVLHRGTWTEADCLLPGINTLQIFNGENNRSLQAGIKLWKKLLLDGKKTGIAAGSDAHGNFNCYRQISIPFLRLVHNRSHLLGQARTAVFTQDFSLPGILEALRKHRSIISSGPFAEIRLEGKQSAGIGDTFQRGKNDRIRITLKNIPEYGKWRELALYFGNYEKQAEVRYPVAVNKNRQSLTQMLDFPELPADYVRLEAFSGNAEDDYLCLTNPIWIKKEL